MPFLMLCAVLFSCVPAHAERFAVLAGISHYLHNPMPPDLLGAANDVMALKRVLVSRYGFDEKNITLCLNERATKKAFLETLQGLKDKTREGDFLLIYFSGHGTSGHDPDTNLPIFDNSGAIVPYEFDISPDVQRMLGELIIGRRDLRPILSELDNGRQMVVIFDSCFSGNTVRGIGGIARPKSFPLGHVKVGSASKGLSLVDNSYPYKNVIYVSAADENEQAKDLDVSSYDSTPHGALTDALLMGLSGAADTNHDNMITYEELYQFARQTTRQHGHTPQVLHQSTLDFPVFGSGRPGTGASQTPPPAAAVDGHIRVAVDPDCGSEVKAAAGRIEGVETVSGGFADLMVKKEGGGFHLFLSGGESWCRVEQVEELPDRIAKFVKLRRLLDLRNPRQDFNVWLNAMDYDGKSVFLEGQKLGFKIRSEADADILLLSLDAKGDICVLLPESAAQMVHIPANGVFYLPDSGVVQPPFGTDFLKVFAFREKMEGLREFMEGKGVFNCSDEKFDRFLALVEKQEGWAQTSMQVVTAANP